MKIKELQKQNSGKIILPLFIRSFSPSLSNRSRSISAGTLTSPPFTYSITKHSRSFVWNEYFRDCKDTRDAPVKTPPGEPRVHVRARTHGEKGVARVLQHPALR